MKESGDLNGRTSSQKKVNASNVNGNGTNNSKSQYVIGKNGKIQRVNKDDSKWNRKFKYPSKTKTTTKAKAATGTSSKTANKKNKQAAEINIKSSKSSPSKASQSISKGVNKTKPRKNSSKSSSNNNSPKKGNKQSPELRPRRRASQTYFFKYQLARNPLKAEEEDLKLALLASLQQCGDSNSDNLITGKSPIADDNIVKSTTKGKKSKKIPTAKAPKAANKFRKNSSCSASSGGSSSTTIPLSNGFVQKGSGKAKYNRILTEPLSSSSSTASASSTPELNHLNSIHSNNEANKPETEDFLTFICLRQTTAPNYKNYNHLETNGNSSPSKIPSTIVGNNKNDPHNLKLQCNISPNKVNNYNINLHSPIANNYRKPVRQSPRLASSHQKKISENNDTSSTATFMTATAYENTINYEEDMKRASIALEDMAQEISNSYESNLNNNNSTNSNNNSKTNTANHHDEVAQKHLVKGLMTREFAGAFADEETIFESISNHKLL